MCEYLTFTEKLGSSPESLSIKFSVQCFSLLGSSV